MAVEDVDEIRANVFPRRFEADAKAQRQLDCTLKLSAIVTTLRETDRSRSSCPICSFSSARSPRTSAIRLGYCSSSDRSWARRATGSLMLESMQLLIESWA